MVHPSFRALGRVLAAATALAVAALWVPIVTMAISSFNATELGPAWGGLSTRWYARLFAEGVAHASGASTMPLVEAARGSLLVATAVTVISVGLGTPGAWLLHRRAGIFAATLRATLGIPLVLPEILLGVSLLVTFRTLRLELGFPTVVLAHVSFCLPFVLTAVEARLEALDPALEEAAMDLGATEARAFVSVILPAVMPAVLSSALLCFALSLDELVVTYFTRGPGSPTLPVVMYGMARVGVSPYLHAASTILVALTTALVLVGDRVGARRSVSATTDAVS